MTQAKKSPEEFVAALTERLVNISERCLSAFGEVSLRSRKKIMPSGLEIRTTTLAPTKEHQRACRAIAMEYKEWLNVVVAFISRVDRDQAEQFLAIGNEFISYLLLSRVGTNISREQWREAFRREVRSLVVLQVETINQNINSFSILRPREKVQYHDFVVRISRTGSGKYKLAARCFFGEAERISSLPFSERQVENFILKHCLPRGSTRGWIPSLVRPLVDFGEKMFQWMISGKVRDLFGKALQFSELRGEGLRLKLSVGDAPELLQIPWELLYDGKKFLCLSNSTPVIRYLEPESISMPQSLLSSLPLRVLVTVSAPKGLPRLNQEGEKERALNALAPLIALGLLRVDFSPNGTLNTLQRMLRRASGEGDPYCIWHYIGHGTYDDIEKASFLIFEDRVGRGKATGGFELGALLSGYPALKVALLNTCNGAQTSSEDLFSSVASALVRHGMPAVIAMQFAVSDEAATMFSEEFYASITDGLPIDAAVTEARRSIFLSPNYVEWATPVLFMRTEDGIVFEL